MRRTIFETLPNIYQDEELSQAPRQLTQYFDNELANKKQGLLTLDLITKYFNPLTCEEEWLDYLAGLFGWSGPYWERSFPVPTKRSLLSQSFSVIWPQRGTIYCLTTVLLAFGIRHVIQEGSAFIIGSNVVGDPIGFGGWTFKVILPSEYLSSLNYKRVEWAIRLFSPLWCEAEIELNDEYFNNLTLVGGIGTEFMAIEMGDPNSALGESAP